MNIYTEQFSFTVNSPEDFSSKASQYFSKYNFKEDIVNENHVMYSRKASFLEGWKMNPLHWESLIDVTVENTTVNITYKVFGLYITPRAFKTLYSGFIANFKESLNKNTDQTLENKALIIEAKQRLTYIYLVYVFAIVIGIFLGGLVKNWLDGSIFSILIFLGTYFIAQRGINEYLENKYG